MCLSEIRLKVRSMNFSEVAFSLTSTGTSGYFKLYYHFITNDQDRISPYNINTLSSRQVMRIKKNMN